MKAKQSVSVRASLKTKYMLVGLAGIALLGVLIFFSFFGFNILGLQNQGVAGTTNPSRYPFDLSESVLKKVNFTVLAPQINSVFAEVRPYITANGKELFFCRRNHPDNVLKQKDKQDIWSSSLRSDGTWSAPKNLGITINSKNADAICSVNADGSEIVFISDKMDPAKPLLRSVKKGDGWSEPVAMEIENFYNDSEYIDFYYSFEVNVLLMAVERKDSQGEQDLYVSLPKGKNKWSEPKNLGPVVNSKLSDFAPFLSVDGKTLYFSSYGHQGFGGCDIYQTTRLDESWRNWSKPKNLGEGINSAREESYFSVSGDYAHIYFESYDLKNEVRDLFRADLPKNSMPGLELDEPVVVVRK